jgi:hypothetical protein
MRSGWETENVIQLTSNWPCRTFHH